MLFRPFPNEADTSFQLATSIERVALIALAALSWSRLRSVPGSFLRSPYDRFAVVYTVGFIIAFSALANFGILARQRAQLWPIVLVLYALPVKKPALGLVPDAARLISVRQPAESAS